MFTTRLKLFLLFTFLLLPALACTRPEAGTVTADRILFNGKIITVDPDDRITQALAILDDRILALGSDEEMLALAGPDTERIDLGGRTATPGLLDAHCHFLSGGVDQLYELDLSYPAVESVADVREHVRQQAERLQPGEWILGRGWDEGKLEENRYIYASDLDEVAPQNPVWLTHTMGHYGVGNSLALSQAGIDRNSPDPVGGTIDRDPAGNPTGVLKESAQRLVRNLVPDLTAEQRREGLRHIVREFNKEGMTGLKEPGIGRTQWEAYREVQAEGELSVRVFALWRPAGTMESARQMLEKIGPFSRASVSTGDDHLVSGGIKLAIDGSGGARTAWLWEEWNKDSTSLDEGNTGYPVTDPETLRKMIRLFHNAGLHVSVHSIGDRGIDWVVESLEMVLEDNPIKGLRHGIIHANIPSDKALAAMARLQREYDAAYPEPSATFMWWIGDTYAGNFGPERALRLNPYQTYKQMGILWADGSDFGVTPFPARLGIWASMARETLLGVHGKNPWGMEEAVDARTALRSRTIWAARQMFMEDKIGSLEPGKLADIAVWDRDLYSIDTADIKDMKCTMTLFNGEIVHRIN